MSQNLPCLRCLGQLNISFVTKILSFWAVFRHTELFLGQNVQLQPDPPCHCHLLLFNSLTISFGQLSLKKAFMLVGWAKIAARQIPSQHPPLVLWDSTTMAISDGCHLYSLNTAPPACAFRKFIIKASCKRKPNSSNTIVSHSVKVTVLPSCILYLFDYKKP